MNKCLLVPLCIAIVLGLVMPMGLFVTGAMADAPPAIWEVVGTYPVGNAPFRMEFDGENIWVANWGWWAGNTVTKLRASDGFVLDTYVVGTGPCDLLFDGLHMWVANHVSKTVMKLNPSNGDVLATYSMGNDPYQLGFDGANIWVANTLADELMKIRVSDGAIFGPYTPGNRPSSLAFDGTYIWVTNREDNNVMKIQTSDGAVAATYAMGSDGPYYLDFDGTHMWILNRLADTVMKVDISDGTILNTYSTGGNWPIGLTFDDDSNVWISNNGDDTVTRLRSSDGAILGTYDVGDKPHAIVFDGANMWVPNFGDDTVMKLKAVPIVTPVGNITSCDSEGNEKNHFAPNDSVYVKGTGLESDTSYKIWIQENPIEDGQVLDVVDDPSGERELVTTDSSGDFGVTEIWHIDSDVAPTFRELDIVVDKQGDGGNTTKFNCGSDGIDSLDAVGFTAPVPEIATLILLGIGLIGLAGWISYRRRIGGRA